MIPDPIFGTAPESEKMVFETFKYATNPLAREWTIFHSVEIESTGIPTDSFKIDFVILDWTYYSVICLEVVAEEQRENWSSTTPPSRLANAEAVTELLRKHFAMSHFNPHSPLALGYAAVYPTGVQFDEQALPEHLGPMFSETELPMGLTLLTEYSESCDALNPESLSDMLANYTLHLQTWERISNEEELKKAQMKMHELQSDLESTSMETTTIYSKDLETLREQLLRLTTDQLNSLKRLKINERCVINGAAGTGKTVLAMELARQRCEADQNVALLCSNPNLSNRFERWAEKISENNGGTITVGTPATLPSSVFGNQKLFGYDQVLKNRHTQRVIASPQLEKTLKEGSVLGEWEQFIQDTISDLGQNGVFDYLIVDEAQNLCEEVFLKLMDAILKGGLTNGRWTMFGDFVNQDLITIKREIKRTKPLKDFGLNWSNDELETNCRNTHQIADAITRLVDVESLPMSGVHGPPVQIEYFRSEEKESEELEKSGKLEDVLDTLISTWKNRGFKSRQIVLLSSNSDDEFNTDHEYAGWSLFNINDVPEDFHEDPIISGGASQGNILLFSDVHDFQGLESDLAILVIRKTPEMVELAGGVTLPFEDHLNRVIYTGMSRAKTMLVVVAHESYKEILELRANLYHKLKDLQEAT
jgi:hypothetical protein